MRLFKYVILYISLYAILAYLQYFNFYYQQLHLPHLFWVFFNSVPSFPFSLIWFLSGFHVVMLHHCFHMPLMIATRQITGSPIGMEMKGC